MNLMDAIREHFPQFPKELEILDVALQLMTDQREWLKEAIEGRVGLGFARAVAEDVMLRWMEENVESISRVVDVSGIDPEDIASFFILWDLHGALKRAGLV